MIEDHFKLLRTDSPQPEVEEEGEEYGGEMEPLTSILERHVVQTYTESERTSRVGERVPFPVEEEHHGTESPYSQVLFTLERALTFTFYSLSVTPYDSSAIL